MNPTPTEPDADDGFHRWYVGGAPGVDDLDPAPAPALNAAQAEAGVAPLSGARPDDRPLRPAQALPAPNRLQGWVAVAGSVAALALLWGFYGVVDGAVVRAAQRQLQPLATDAAVAGADQRPAAPAAAPGDDAQRVHAVYELPAGAGAVHYTRWP